MKRMIHPVEFLGRWFMKATTHKYVVEATFFSGTTKMFSLKCRRKELVGKIKERLDDDYEDSDHVLDDDFHPPIFVAVSAYKKDRRVYNWKL